MKTIRELINNKKIDTITSEVGYYKINYPTINLLLDFDLSDMHVDICINDKTKDKLVSFKIKNFDWFEIEKLMNNARDYGCDVSIYERDYLILCKIIDKTMERFFKKNKEHFMGYVVKQYRNKEEYEKEIGEFTGVYSKAISSLTLSNTLVKLNEALATSISVSFKNKKFYLFNFEKAEENQMMLKEPKLLLKEPANV